MKELEKFLKKNSGDEEKNKFGDDFLKKINEEKIKKFVVSK